MSLKRFTELFWRKRGDRQWAKIPRAMRDAFRHPQGESEFELVKLLAEADREQARRYEDELTAQSDRCSAGGRSPPHRADQARKR